MRSLLVIGVLLFLIVFYPPAQAQPPLWDGDFGTELAVVSNCDDCEEAIALPFAFPFNGSTFNMAYVGSNGCIQLGDLGLDNEIIYYMWQYMEGFLSDSDPDNPMICPFDTDLNPGNEGGEIYYNNSDDPLIITWDGVGTYETGALTTFQILLFLDGRIVLNYNGIVNGPGENLIDDLSVGIVAGITPSDHQHDNDNLIIPTDPGPVDLNQGPFAFGPTAYERWCYDAANSCGVQGQNTGLPGPINTAFDLDLWSICFIPDEADGFDVTSGFEGDIAFECAIPEPVVEMEIPTLSEWGLIAMAAILGIVGYLVIRRKKVTA